MDKKSQKTGLERETADKFYTKKDIAQNCVNMVAKHTLLKSEDLIIEPSAGNGSFVEAIHPLPVDNKIFYDIEPEHSDVIKQDYLTCEKCSEIQKATENKKTIHIVGNPPFGRQSSLAKRFIKKSCEFAQSISFILPKSFKKESMKKVFPLNFHLVFEMDLPKNSFTVNGQDYDVPCVFQIWVKKNFERTVPERLNPVGFMFVEKEQHHNISFRRVGVNAGKIDTETGDKSKQSHYFIRFINEHPVEKNMDWLKNIVFDNDNTVGPKSISKQELIQRFNQALNDR